MRTEFWATVTICEYLEKLGFTLTIGEDIIQSKLREMVPKDEEIQVAYQKALDLSANPKFLKKMKGGLTGVIAILDTGKKGPIFQYEVDIDALPIKESTDKITFLSRKDGILKMKEKCMLVDMTFTLPWDSGLPSILLKIRIFLKENLY